MSSNEVSFTVFKGSRDGRIRRETTTVPSLTGDQVLVSITASGLCGTDLHYKYADIALGHEGVGVVRAVSPGVQKMRVGDRVGWGYVHDSCGECGQCLGGTENYCPERHLYGQFEKHQGSFGSAAVWREAFLFKLPDNVTDEDAAPLMCGGATVFNALEMYQTDPSARVGIVGIGGLGHLAIQFASKMGCDTVVFSGSEGKREEALQFGANAFYATNGVEELDIGRKVDVLLVTSSAQPDWKLFLSILAPQSTIFPLSVLDGDLVFPYSPLLAEGLRIQGSIVAPRLVQKKMLDFAALHGIKPMINKFEMSEAGIEEAMAQLEGGKMRYRGVLVNSM